MKETRVYAGKLAGMTVLDPDGDSIGQVRDVIITLANRKQLVGRVLGLVVELPNKRQIFMPMLRVADINPSEVTMASASVNVKPFRTRSGELSVLHELVGAKVYTDDPDFSQLQGRAVEIVDVELERGRTRDWLVRGIAVTQRTRLGRRSVITALPLASVQGLHAGGAGPSDANTDLLVSFQSMRPADVAIALNDLPDDQRNQLVNEIPDDRLADVIAELPDDTRTDLLSHLAIERAAEVLEEMEPDDAANALAELPEDTSDVLLELMDPEDSEPVRRLMTFNADSVGGLMSPEAIILTPQATVAEALAHARNPDVSNLLSSMVFVVRPPQSTPTGHYLGCIPLQKLLREPPSTLVGEILDLDLPALYAEDTHETAARYFATYNLVCGPVLDPERHLLGVVAVDDLLDALLPEDWREEDWRTNA